MKIRNGFVSNSSSSSFIVSTKKAVKEIPVVIEADLMDLITVSIETEEELNRYVKHHYGCDSYESADEYEKKRWDKMKKAIAEGNVLHCGRGSNEDSDTLSMEVYEHGLRGLKLPKGIKIIQEDNE
jgi:hypothetical protein